MLYKLQNTMGKADVNTIYKYNNNFSKKCKIYQLQLIIKKTFHYPYPQRQVKVFH